MIIGYNGEQHDIPDENVAVLLYPNDMMNGLFIDLDDNYVFVSAWQTGSDEFIAEAISLGAEQYELGEDAEIDWTAPPHAWVVASLARLVVKSAEELLDQQA